MNIQDIYKKIMGQNNKKVVFYTSIFGNYDSLKEPAKSLLQKSDFICFTDNKKLKSNSYRIIYCERNKMNEQMQSRQYKILPYKYLPKEYEWSIWIDGSIQLNDFDIDIFFDKYLKNSDWASFVHPDRCCIYDEAEVCISLKKDSSQNIMKQITKYELEGYPKNNGLLANGFIARKHNNQSVIDVCDMWWKEMKNGSKRDQLSFCYVAWKMNFDYKIIEDNIWSNQYFSVLKHNI